MRTAALLLSMVLLLTGGCGYGLANKRANAGAGKTIAVPTFVNDTTSFSVEQRMSEALRRELLRRTRYKVTSAGSGDVLVSGEVLQYVANPNTITAGRASSFIITVVLKVEVKEMPSGRILFQNASWVFRENFELAPNSAQFVPEEPAAVNRVAAAFASSLVATLLNPTP